jgi:hypothetical protein
MINSLDRDVECGGSGLDGNKSSGVNKQDCVLGQWYRGGEESWVVHERAISDVEVSSKKNDGASVSARTTDVTALKWSSEMRSWVGSDGDECNDKRQCKKDESTR